MFIPLEELPDEFSTEIAAHGYCNACGKEHSLPYGHAQYFARNLLAELEEKGDMLLPIPPSVENNAELQEQVDALQGNPRYSLDYLWGKALGQMLGIMVCRKQDGTYGIVRAFSGQYDRLYQIPGWVPPVMDLDRYNSVNAAGSRVVNAYSDQIDALDKSDHSLLQQLKKERKACSRALMAKLYSLYILRNFRGQQSLLTEAFYSEHGMRTGTADCCAPKLLHYAQLNNLTPLGLAEFFYGAENRSQTRQHGTFYEACKEKCQPILGFMLCGLDEKKDG